MMLTEQSNQGHRTPYVPAYMQSNFCQSPPKDPDHLELLTEDTRKSGQLLYRDRETGEEFLVPNIPCNQQTYMRLDYFRFLLAMAKGRNLAGMDRWALMSHEDCLRGLDRAISAYEARLKLLNQR